MEEDVRTIIAGSRDLGKAEVDAAMSEYGIVPTVVLSGAARGVDRAGELWAVERRIPIERYPAEWDRFGKMAGFKRNSQMASVAEALVAVWDGESRGTNHMIKTASEKGLRVFVWNKLLIKEEAKVDVS